MPVARPCLTVVAGPNGSGKTTVMDALREKGLDFGEYINPDDIAKRLPGGSDRASADERSRAAQRIAETQREDALTHGRSLTFETVFSHPSKLDFMRRAKERGYWISLIFVCLATPDLNVQRVKSRVAMGEHDVPEEKIRARRERTLELFPQALAIADEALIFDNSSHEKDQGARLIAAKAGGVLHIRAEPALLATPELAWFRDIISR